MARSYWIGTLWVLSAWVALGGVVSLMLPAQTPIPPTDRIITVGVAGQKLRCKVIASWKLPNGGQALQIQAIETQDMLTIVQDSSVQGGIKETPVRVFRWADNKTSPIGVPVPPASAFTTVAAPKAPAPLPSLANLPTAPIITTGAVATDTPKTPNVSSWQDVSKNMPTSAPSVTAASIAPPPTALEHKVQPPMSAPVITNGPCEECPPAIVGGPKWNSAPEPRVVATSESLSLRDRLRAMLGKAPVQESETIVVAPSMPSLEPVKIIQVSEPKTNTDPLGQAPWAKPGETVNIQPGKLTVDIAKKDDVKAPEIILNTASAEKISAALPPAIAPELPAPRKIDTPTKATTTSVAKETITATPVAKDVKAPPKLPALPVSIPNRTAILPTLPTALTQDAVVPTQDVVVPAQEDKIDLPSPASVLPGNGETKSSNVTVTVTEQIVEVSAEGTLPGDATKVNCPTEPKSGHLANLFKHKAKASDIGPACAPACVPGTICGDAACSTAPANCTSCAASPKQAHEKMSIHQKLLGMFSSHSKSPSTKNPTATCNTCPPDAPCATGMPSLPSGTESISTYVPVPAGFDRTRAAVTPGSYDPTYQPNATITAQPLIPGKVDRTRIFMNSTDVNFTHNEASTKEQVIEIHSTTNAPIPQQNNAPSGKPSVYLKPMPDSVNRTTTLIGLTGRTMNDHPGMPKVAEVPERTAAPATPKTFVTTTMSPTTPAALAANTANTEWKKNAVDPNLFQGSNQKVNQVAKTDGMETRRVTKPQPKHPSHPMYSFAPPQPAFMPNPYAGMPQPSVAYVGQPMPMAIPAYGYPPAPPQTPVVMQPQQTAPNTTAGLQQTAYSTPANPSFTPPTRHGNVAMDRPGPIAVPQAGGDPMVLGQLMQTLKDSPHPSHREWAVSSLATYDWRVQPQVLAILNHVAVTDPAATVRAACVHTLGRMNAPAPAVFNTLQTLRSDADVRVRHEVEQLVERFNATTNQ